MPLKSLCNQKRKTMIENVRTKQDWAYSRDHLKIYVFVNPYSLDKKKKEHQGLLLDNMSLKGDVSHASIKVKVTAKC